MNTLIKVLIGAVAIVAVAIFGVALSSGGIHRRRAIGKRDAPPETEPVRRLAPGRCNDRSWLARRST